MAIKDGTFFIPLRVGRMSSNGVKKCQSVDDYPIKFDGFGENFLTNDLGSFKGRLLIPRWLDLRAPRSAVQESMSW